MQNRLYRSNTNRIIWGVCGGIAEYFNIDPVIIRIIAILLIFANGFGVIAYIIMAIIVPRRSSKSDTPEETIKENVEEIKQTATQWGEEIRSTFSKEGQQPPHPATHTRGLFVLGVVLLALGVILLLNSLFPVWWLNWKYLWPIIIIAISLLIIFSSRRK
jgi:phage shock protein C